VPGETPTTPVERDAVGPSRQVPGLRTVSDRPSPIQRMRDLWAYRELLRNLIRKELKVKYKSSALGFVWTLLNPTLYLVVFSIVFKFILQSTVPYFAVFLLSGLMCWNLFTGSVAGGCSSIVANAGLVQKVWMPREILPLASIGASLVHFCFQLTVLAAALIVFRLPPAWEYLPVLILAMVVLLVLSAALAIALSAINVYLRDTQHLLELVLLAWFWLSAIVYPYRQVADRLGTKSWILLLNPVIPIVLAFQRVIYNPAPEAGILPPDAGIGWYIRNLAVVGVGSIVLLFLSLLLFGRLEDNLAEEI
jgi:ABC-2 type transport system permease protein